MIRRNSAKANISLVNTATQEHYNITSAVKDGAPLTDATSVVKSINFDSDSDGSYVLRKPLILTERVTPDTFYLYDNEHLFNYENENGVTQIIQADSNITITFKFYDLNFEQHSFVLQSNEMSRLSFISRILGHVNAQDATILSIQINRDSLDEFVYPYPSILHDANKLQYGNSLYRFLKVYQDQDIENGWVLELLNPELNTITSATDVGNAESLAFNLALDNPLAVRDLYNYGANGTTKILSYEVINGLDIYREPVYVLTESKNPNIRLIESYNTVMPTASRVLLKAFIQTSKNLKYTGMQFYCCWEYSTNQGVDWKVVPSFISRFRPKGRVVTKNVSDITSADFEKLTAEETLEKAADYIFEKELVSFDPNMTESDLIEDRPDILEIPNSQRPYTFRFQVYVDTDRVNPKETEHTLETLEDSASGFTNTGYENNVYGNSKDFKFRTYKCYGSTTNGNIILNAKVDATILDGHNDLTVDVYLTSDTVRPYDVAFIKSKDSDTFYLAGTYVSKTERSIEAMTLHGTPVDAYGRPVSYMADIVMYKYDAVVLKIPGVTSVYSKKATLTLPGGTLDIFYYDFPDIGRVGFVANEVELLPEPLSADTNYNRTLSEPTLAESGILVLNTGGNNNVGNTLVITSNDNSLGIYDVEVTLAPSPDSSRYLKSKVGINKGTIVETATLDNFRYYEINAGDSKKLLAEDYETETVGSDVTEYTPIYNQVTIGCCSQDSNEHARIASIKVYFIKKSDGIKRASTYVVSSTGAYNFAYSDTAKFVSGMANQHRQLYTGNLTYYDYQIISSSGYNVFFSKVDSAIFGTANTLTFGTAVTKVLKWRSYLMIFTSSSIYLNKYDYASDMYISKVISTNIGLSREDADTATVILSNIYFKSADKIYALYPNQYAADDSFLTLRYVSNDVYNFLNSIQINCVETHNFKYSDAQNYYIFIPVNYDLELEETKSVTYCVKYNYIAKTWTIHKYQGTLLGLEELAIDKVFVRTNLGLCIFNKDPKVIFAKYVYSLERVGVGCTDGSESYLDLGGTTSDGEEYFKISTSKHDVDDTRNSASDYINVYNRLPYADYNTCSIVELYNSIERNPDPSSIEEYANLYQEIPFMIDFGQKSLNYTVDKQFIESKFTLATLQSKDTIPVQLDVETDGEGVVLHKDCNTSGALWRDSLFQKGTLNTIFHNSANTNYNGILRQLIVKYSGKGKTIRQRLSGNALTLFKVYSVDVRYRVLPKKQ